MSWDYTLAAALNALRGEKSGPVMLEGTIVNTGPLTVSFRDGEVMAPPLPLEEVANAAGLTTDPDTGELVEDHWRTGDRAACCLLGETVVILGKLT